MARADAWKARQESNHPASVRDCGLQSRAQAVQVYLPALPSGMADEW
jgi:hypothetical protein